MSWKGKYLRNQRLSSQIDTWYSYIYPFKFILQMIIGLVILGMLSIDACNLYSSLHSEAKEVLNLKFGHALKTVAFGLGISAGIEMAYMLFTPGPDEAVEPVILSLAATILYALSVINLDKPEPNSLLGFAVLIAVLVASIGFLFYIKEKFIKNN